MNSIMNIVASNGYNYLRTALIAVATTLILVGCDYELSPWQTDVYCPGQSVDENLALIKQIEQTKQIGDSFKVALLGDPQQFPEDFDETIKLLNTYAEVDFIILLGDLVETGLKQEFEWTCKAMNHSNKPIIPVIGNHDSLSYGVDIWLQTFGEYDFTFSYLGTKFVAYNDNQYEFEDVPDLDWLEQASAISDDETRLHTIGMSHIEPWGRAPDLSQFLAKNGFDQMLHAHKHKFAYYQREEVGLPHFITADTQDVKFAIMTVTPDTITIEQCDPVCLPAEIEIR
ncbi:metallophosphoesterase [Psychrosphaera sp. B3R10]|uniref:metallophosphoesterase family protein n=1 Tax=unclassified Psychrosphaera TaxID=2641570 RepID=UPI001C0A4FFC|nr:MULTISPECIES: metallophosphoesterase [unclassified Psychrosphaera]MBU2882925.1 metallophosphoesterase [Psychrosphaera sp. I2R16]MBU2991322.1 metallophosphoesterase [Psychrosphaera sp. B3R10]MDO6720211.1 metallophosphoesterase [Psychrosphaera sp. 1_MG-2023]